MKDEERYVGDLKAALREESHYLKECFTRYSLLCNHCMRAMRKSKVLDCPSLPVCHDSSRQVLKDGLS